MDKIRKLHEKAMDTGEVAFVAKLKGDLKRAKLLFRQAFEHEARAARMISKIGATEPTRSVFYRSAASFAVDCGKFREAERLVAEGLAGDPPAEMIEELQDVLVSIDRLEG